MGSVRSTRSPAAAAALSLALALGCAGASDAPAAPPAFSGVRSVALVRRADHGEKRPKDPLDAVSESLAARGIVVRLVELRGREDPKDVARLFDSAESRATSGSPGGPGGPGTFALGGEAGRAVRGLGVDAVVTYHRLDARFARAVGDGSGVPAGAGAMSGASPRPTTYRPLGALEIVGTDGQAALFDWGVRDQLPAGGAETPAEAVDAVVRALLGEQAEPDGA